MVNEEGQQPNNDNNETSDDPVIKMRGLPWSATVDDIMSFLECASIKNGRAGIHITMSREGRPSGEAFVELESLAEVEKAMTKDKKHMGHRYIEIFQTNRADMDWYLERSGSNVENVMDECCIRLRGLPFGCTKDDITKFFTGLTIVPNGISFVSDQTGRNTGEAYVQFVNKEMVESALKKHLDRIGHRYIEIFRSSLAEINSQTGPKIRPLMSEAVARPSPYDRGDRFGGMNRFGRGPPPPAARAREFYEDDFDYGNTWGARKPGGPMRDSAVPQFGNGGPLSPPPAARMRNLMYGAGSAGMGEGSLGSGWEEEEERYEERYTVRMRGLPYRATEQDIFDFFKPLVPINVQIIFEGGGRPSGEAEVDFETYEDAERAMEKDKQNINNRYIELFLRPTSSDQPPSLGGGNASSGFLENNDSLFSRRGGNGGGGSTSVSNSAYDGFYGTSMYKAASSGNTAY